jgi:hypothetical protein
MVAPELTRCCTQDGEEEADGRITWGINPSGMEDWAWSRPSSSQMRPNAILMIRRAGGSEERSSREFIWEPWSLWTDRRSCKDRNMFKLTPATAKINSTISPW